jgi:mRNA interferase YafQ
MHRLKEVILLLIAADGPLPPEWFDHALTGAWTGFRECHVGGDFLLVYRIDAAGSFETVYFARTGTHADLFE